MSARFVRNLLRAAAIAAGVVVAGVLWRGGRVPPPAPLASTAGALPERPAEALVAGLDALYAGRLDEARDRLLEVPPHDPSYTLALDDLVVVEERARGIEGAATAFGALARSRPGDVEVRLRWADLLARAGHAAEAERAAREILAADPSRSEAAYALGLARLAQDDLTGAISAYLDAMGRDPRGIGARAALVSLERHAAARPGAPEPQYALALFYKVLRRPADERRALAHYLAAGGPEPAAGQARRRLAELGPGSGSPEGGP